jgi:desulfoferrodoxin-like iron-binding protein
MRFRVYRDQGRQRRVNLLQQANGTEEIDFGPFYRRNKMANQLGKRFKCEVCGSEVLCTKAGAGTVVCDGKEMELQKPKALPSSD